MPTKTMKNNKENVNFLINKTILKDLLMQAYEEGWCGSKDLAESTADEIVGNYQKKATAQEAKKSTRARIGSTRPVNVYYSEEALDSETVQYMYGSDEVAPANPNPVQEEAPANVVYGAPSQSMSGNYEAYSNTDAVGSIDGPQLDPYSASNNNSIQLEFTLQESTPEPEMEVESENIGTEPNTSAEEEMVEEDYDENWE